MTKKYITLGEACEKRSSNIAQKDLSLGSGPYKVYGASGLLGTVDFYTQKNEYIGVVKDGAGVGRAMLLPEKTSCLGTMQYLIPKKHIDVRFLFYAIENMNLAKYNTGATIPHIYFKDYKNETLPLLELKEQMEIAYLLDKIRLLATSRQTQLKKLDNLVKSQFIEMFGDPIDNQYHWAVVTIGDVVTEVRYGTSRPAVDGGKYPYLRMNNITYDGQLDLSDIKYIDIPDGEIDKCLVRKGDVLFNRTNSVDLVGKTCMFGLDTNMVIAGYIIRVRLNNKLLPVVLSNYMNLSVIKRRMRDMAKGAVNQANINAQELKSIKVYLPPIELQNEFARFVEQTDKSKFRIKQSLEKLELCYKSLLQKYFG